MKRGLLLALMLVLAGGAAWAGTYEHPESGLSIWFPDNWKIKADGDVLEADAPDGDAYAQLMMLEEAESLEAAVDSLVEELDPIVKDFQLTTEGEEAESNGLNFYLVEGEGMVDDVKMGVSVVLIATPKEKVGLLVALCPEVVYKKYEKDFERIVRNLKAL